MLSAAEAVFLKRALLLSSPGVTFIFWCSLGLPIAIVASYVAFRDELKGQIRAVFRDRRSSLLLAATTGAMQLSTLFTLGALEVGYSLALFQTSTLLTVLFGHHFFKEQRVLRRMVSAVIMIAGAVLIAAFGGRG